MKCLKVDLRFGIELPIFRKTDLLLFNECGLLND